MTPAKKSGPPPGGKKRPPTAGAKPRAGASRSAAAPAPPSRASRRRRRSGRRRPAVDVHDPDGVRLQKLLAAAGVGSRRVCEDLITAGPGRGRRPASSPSSACGSTPTQTVHVDGMRVQLDESRVYLAFNKPLGVVSTMSDELGRVGLGDFVANRKERLFHVGRLDADTEGLLLLTNDGDLAHRLQHPRTACRRPTWPRSPARCRATSASAARGHRARGRPGPGRLVQGRRLRARQGARRGRAARGPQAHRAPHARGGRPPGASPWCAPRSGPIRLGDPKPGKMRTLNQRRGRGPLRRSWSCDRGVRVVGTGLIGTSLGHRPVPRRVSPSPSTTLPTAAALARDLGRRAAARRPGRARPRRRRRSAGRRRGRGRRELRRWPDAVVTDVASVKVAVLDAPARRGRRPDPLRRVAPDGRPRAVRRGARRGPTCSTAAPGCVAPDRARPTRRSSRWSRPWRRSAGAAVSRLEPAAHDAAVAAVSHVPQVAASLVAGPAARRSTSPPWRWPGRACATSPASRPATPSCGPRSSPATPRPCARC